MNMEWRQIPGFPDYEASNEGQIRRAVPSLRSSYTGHLMSQKVQYAKSGKPVYMSLSLRDASGARHTVCAHTLIAAAFHGPRPSPLHEVAHSDGNGMNNNPDNLRWATRKENNDDRYIHGTIGGPNNNAKLSWDDVALIRSNPSGEKQMAMAVRYGVHRVTIMKIQQGVTWKEIPCQSV